MSGEKEMPLVEFLKVEVPDWEDEVVARARYKGFTGQRADWENRLQFWKDLVVKCARHLDLLVIDPYKVQNQWFLREGVTPMGMPIVLNEMRNHGELQTREELLRSKGTFAQYTGFMFKQVFGWMGSQVLGKSGSSPQANALPNRLIVTPLLQERISFILNALSEAEWRHVCVVTAVRFQELCGCSDTADILMGVLIKQGKARHIVVGGTDNIEGLKISLKNGPVPDATETDKHILLLQWTLERLQQQSIVLDQQVQRSRSAAINSLKTGDKQAALRHERRLKTLISSKEKCETFMDRIDEVLAFIADAEATKKVTDAMKLGAHAMKENHVTLSEVHTCLEELDEAISQQRETQESLGEASLTLDADDASLEEEFESLQAEIDTSSVDEVENAAEAVHGESNPVHTESMKTNTSSHRVSTPPLATTESVQEKQLKDGDEDEDSLERAFAKLELELT